MFSSETGLKREGQPVFSPDSIARLYAPVAERLGIYSLVFDAYGLGHYLETLPSGSQAVAHGGQGTGWMTHFHAVPETGDGIVILTNSQRSWPLIAYVLTDWAKWSGFSTIGMSRIILGKNLLWAVVGLIWCIVLWRMWNLVEELVRGLRHLSPGSAQACFVRMAVLGCN